MIYKPEKYLTSAGVEVIQTPAEVTMNDGVVKNINDHIEMTNGKISFPLMALSEMSLL